MVSMNSVWDESVAFIRREARLLVPLALATIMTGSTIVTLTQAIAPRGGLAPSLILLLATSWSLVGQLSVTALALRPGSSVREAIGLALQRFGSVILVGLIFATGVVIMAIPLFYGLARSGLDLAQPQTVTVIPAWATVYIVVFMVIAGWFGIRLCILSPLIVDRNPSVPNALRQAFALTSGLTLRLLLPLLVFVVVNVILSLAVRYVFGALGIVIGNALGSPFSGAVIVALATGLVAAATSLVFTTFLATLYRRLNTGI